MPAVSKLAGSDDQHARVYRWEAFTTSDRNGDAVYAPAQIDRTISVRGTFGTAGQIVADGSHDGTNWFELNDPQGSPIAITAEGLEQIQEATPYIRPRLESGDGATDLDVDVFIRGNR